jgi:1-aminocyclopropane-1-carboxylate deaminase
VAGIDDFAVQVPPPLVELRDKALERHGIRLFIKRDDLIHRGER